MSIFKVRPFIFATESVSMIDNLQADKRSKFHRLSILLWSKKEGKPSAIIQFAHTYNAANRLYTSSAVELSNVNFCVHVFLFVVIHHQRKEN